VLDALAEFQPDAVNCHSFYGGLPYEMLAEISNRYATCFTVHDPRPIGTIEPVCWSCERNAWCLRCPLLSSRWRRLLKNPFLRERIRKRRCHARCAADLTIVTPSKWMGRRLQQQELKRFRFQHIPNGIDLSRFRPAAGNRAKFGLPENRFVLLHLAWHAGDWSINDRKGLRYLAAAFEKIIAPRFPDCVLAVAGESFVPNHPNVRPLGLVHHENLPELLSSIDLFVTPTLADNFPYTVIEAMGCAKPVVASDVGGLGEQIEHGVTGLLVPPRDPRALGDAVTQLLSTPARLREYGEQGRRKANAEFGVDRFWAAYETLLSDLAARRQRGLATGKSPECSLAPECSSL
jgi:glycosyltransferase involved in cell wall biosynthesis